MSRSRDARGARAPSERDVRRSYSKALAKLGAGNQSRAERWMENAAGVGLLLLTLGTIAMVVLALLRF